MGENTIMDFENPKFWEFALLNNHYQVSKNERKSKFQSPELSGSYRD